MSQLGRSVRHFHPGAAVGSFGSGEVCLQDQDPMVIASTGSPCQWQGRCLGGLALSSLLGGMLAHATPTWAGTLSPTATTTATSALAFRSPAQIFTVTTAADLVDPSDG